MVNIHKFWNIIKLEIIENPSFIFLVAALLCIPLNYAFNSISLILLFVMTLITFKKKYFKIEIHLLLPILLYLLMLLSVFWTVDLARTQSALLKELPLLIVPICFVLFGNLSAIEKQKILKFYSFGIVIFAVFYLIKAFIRFFITNDSSVFFYHELVTKDVNAIHVSLYVAIAFFYFYTKPNKKIVDFVLLVLLAIVVFLLSSTNTIIIFILLMICYHLFYSKISKKLRLKNLILLIILVFSLSFIGKIKDQFLEEYETLMTDSSVNDVISKENEKVYNVSIKQAWTNPIFQQNDYFPGTAFRVYQMRIFIEMLQEKGIFWNGFGLDASYSEIEKKGIQYNIFLGNEKQAGYQTKNFHNQYIQIFAELGFFGLLLILAMLYITIKNAFRNKDFIQIAFAVLMISLFMTESFLWRQRGITFFILMYCIFNSNIKPEKTVAH
jgi:O-antigen ligase